MTLLKSVLRESIKNDIQSFLDNDGVIIVSKQRTKHKMTTFRNNKYSAFNLGAKALTLRNIGIYSRA